MKTYNRRSSHGHHGSNRRELRNMHTHMDRMHSLIQYLLISGNNESITEKLITFQAPCFNETRPIRENKSIFVECMYHKIMYNFLAFSSHAQECMCK